MAQLPGIKLFDTFGDIQNDRTQRLQNTSLQQRNQLGAIEAQVAPQRAQNALALQGQQLTEGQQTLDANAFKTKYLEARALAASQDPISDAKSFAPDLVKMYEGKNGPGSWDQAQPTAIKALVTQYLPVFAAKAGIEHKVTYHDAGGSLVPVDETGAPAQGVAPIVKTAAPKDPIEAQKFQLQQNQAAETARHNRATEAGSVGGGQAVYDPDTLRTAAVVVASDPARMRDYATYGKAGQEARIEIQKQITQLKKDTGMTDGDFVQARIRAKAQAGSIQKMTAQQNNMEAFEGLAKANGQRLLDLFARVDSTGIPIIEGFKRAAARSGGSVDAKELQSVLTTFVAETSRILSNPNMTGVVSDSARKEVNDMASGDMSVGQANRVIKRLFTEMDLRKQFVAEQIDKASGQTVVGGPQNQPTSQAPAAAPPQISSPADYDKLPSGAEYVAPDGSHRKKS